MDHLTQVLRQEERRSVDPTLKQVRRTRQRASFSISLNGLSSEWSTASSSNLNSNGSKISSSSSMVRLKEIEKALQEMSLSSTNTDCTYWSLCCFDTVSVQPSFYCPTSSGIVVEFWILCVHYVLTCWPSACHLRILLWTQNALRSKRRMIAGLHRHHHPQKMAHLPESWANRLRDLGFLA